MDKLKKIGANALVALFTVSVFLFFGFIAIMLPANSSLFYKVQFEKYDTLTAVRSAAVYLNDENAKEYIADLTEEELLSLMQHTMRYCLYLEDDLNITVDGEYLEIFLDEQGETLTDGCLERTHMADVKKLFGGGTVMVGVALVIIAVGLIFVFKYRDYYAKYCRKTPYIALIAVFGLLCAVGIYAAVDFDSAFTLFHEIFFSGKQWQFGYGVMISMIGEIFYDIVPIIVGIWATLLVAFVVGLVFFNKRRKKSD